MSPQDAPLKPLPPAAPPGADDAAPPRPIGPERLRALREAILNGTYPLEQRVVEGLAELFRPAAGATPPSPRRAQPR